MSTKSASRIPPLAFLALAATVIATAWWGISALASAKPAENKDGKAAPEGPPPANVILAPVQSITSAQTHRVIGTLKATSRAEIAAREAGAILEISVNEGDPVEKDAVIARIDPRRIEAQIAEARAEITVAEALVHQKQSRVKRSTIDLAMKEKLFASKAISESEVLDARSANNVDNSVYAATQASLKAAASRLELLSVRLQDLEIRAPFAGTVVSRHIEPGEWAEPGASIVTLVSLGDIEAWLQVPERFSNSTQRQKVPVTVSSTGKTIEATSVTLVPEAGPETRTLQMIATLPNPDNTLVSGLSVTADIPVSGDLERLAVPVNAVVQGYAGPGIFVPARKDDGPPVAQRIPVEILFQDDELIYLHAEGLKAGDQVIVEGNERLFPFQPLIIGERNP